MTTCKICGRGIDQLEAFSNGECVDCYERVSFPALSAEERKPDFTRTLSV